MNIKYFIFEFYLQWFRAFQQPHRFEFDKQRNLAIFAPNGTGKSSIVDGLEFILSADGILPRLGNVDDYRLNKAGPDALENNLASDQKKEAQVGIEIVCGGDISNKFGSIQTISQKTHSESDNFKNFLKELNVSPVIRGDELESFITNHSPVHRFEEVVQSLKLTVPNNVLVNSRIYLQERYAELEILNDEYTVLNAELASITDQKLQEYDEKKIVKFINKNLLTPLTSSLKLAKLDQLKSIIDKIRAGSKTYKKPAINSNKSSVQKSVFSYQDTIMILDGLYHIILDFSRLLQTEKSLKQHIDLLESVISNTSQKLKTEIQQLIDQLHGPMNYYYQYLRGGTEQTIKLRIDSDNDTSQEYLKLAVDFASNLKNVQPSGYLSTSQMHSFALAFRLASIKVLNPNVPILILDDIAISYDTEYRSRLANLLGEKFVDFQIILFTRDERFYQKLLDRMGSADWKYERIIRFDPNYGPVFRNYETIEDEMMRHWDEGDTALHLVHQIQEKYAKKMMSDLGIKMPRVASNTKLFQAIRHYLEEKKLYVPGEGESHQDTIQHFYDGLLEDETESIEDEDYGIFMAAEERVRWEEFKQFEDLFICEGCGHNRFMTRDNKMVCKQKECGKEFTFGGNAA